MPQNPFSSVEDALKDVSGRVLGTSAGSRTTGKSKQRKSGYSDFDRTPKPPAVAPANPIPSGTGAATQVQAIPKEGTMIAPALQASFSRIVKIAEEQGVDQTHKSIVRSQSGGEGMEDRNKDFGKVDVEETDYDKEQPTGSGADTLTVDPQFRFLHDPNSTTKPVAKNPPQGGGTDTEVEKVADLAELTQFVPLAGGLVHGMARPAEGTSRLESGLIQGMMGGAGGVAGGVAGGTAGALAIWQALKAMGIPLDSLNENQQNVAIALGLLSTVAGASLGTGVGSALGRWSARRETMTPADWKRLARQMPALSEEGATEKAASAELSRQAAGLQKKAALLTAVDRQITRTRDNAAGKGYLSRAIRARLRGA